MTLARIAAAFYIGQAVAGFVIGFAFPWLRLWGVL
jgi:hypothetical protein